MIVGALLQQQERDRRLSMHCRSPLATIKTYCMDELMGIARPSRGSIKVKKSPAEAKSPIQTQSLTNSLTEKHTSEEEKMVRILQKPISERHFQEIQYLYQELEKLEYFQNLKQRCKDRRYREAINVLHYKFVKKGDFVFKKNETSSEFYIILSGQCFILDDDTTLTPTSKLNMLSERTIPNADTSPTKKPQSNQNANTVFSNFKQAFQCWNENNDSRSNSSSSEEESKQDEKSPDSIIKRQIQQRQTLSRASQINYRASILKLNIASKRESLLHSLFKSSLPNLKIMKLLTKGESFGERAILSKFQKRMEYIQAKEDCHLMYLTKKDYLHIVGNRKTQQIDKISNFLCGFRFLEGWQFGDVKTLSGYFFIDKLTKGEYVYKEGDISQNIFILKKGEISIQKGVNFQLHQIQDVEESRYKKLQKVIEIAALKEGEIFGEEAWVKYESKRCFSIQVKSQKVHLLRINVQKLDDQLWDPNSKQIFSQQAHQKLKWRSDRYDQLLKFKLKEFKGKESVTDTGSKVKLEVIQVTDTPDKELKLEQKFLSSQEDSTLLIKKKPKLQHQMSENVKLVANKEHSSKQLIINDLSAVKEDFLKKFPIAWHLRQQELTLKNTLSSSPSIKISDSVQRLRPVTAKIEEKRVEIFNSQIKSGTLFNNRPAACDSEKYNSDQKLKQSCSIDFNVTNFTIANSTIQSPISNSAVQKQKSLSITNSPKGYFTGLPNKMVFQEEVNLAQTNCSNLSRFHPESQRNSERKISYVDISDPMKSTERKEKNISDFTKPLSTRGSPRISQQGTIDEIVPMKLQRPQSNYLKRQITSELTVLDEEEVKQKEKEFMAKTKQSLRGFSASQKRQNFFLTMSMEEEQEQKRKLYLRKYLEEKQEQQRLDGIKRSSFDYHMDSFPKQTLVKSNSINQNQNRSLPAGSFASSLLKDKELNKQKSKEKESKLINQFSLFDDQYQQYSKEEQERLRSQEQRFDNNLDKFLSVQTSIIEKDMMEALSLKGQQIAKDISQDVQNQNHGFILNLFLKKGKISQSSQRLQRTLDYSNILREKASQISKMKEYLKKKQQSQDEKNQNGGNDVSDKLDGILNFTKINTSQRESIINILKKEQLNNSVLKNSVKKEQIFQSKQQQQQGKNQIAQNNPIKNTNSYAYQRKYSINKFNIGSNYINSPRLIPTKGEATSAAADSNQSSRKFSIINFYEQKCNKIHFEKQEIGQKKSKYSIPRKSSLKSITEQDQQELQDHKNIIDSHLDSQVKKPKKQTNPFDFLSKLIFENKTEDTNKSYKLGKDNEPSTSFLKRPQTTSTFDPITRQLFIQRQQYYIPK